MALAHPQKLSASVTPLPSLDPQPVRTMRSGISVFVRPLCRWLPLTPTLSPHAGRGRTARSPSPHERHATWGEGGVRGRACAEYLLQTSAWVSAQRVRPWAAQAEEWIRPTRGRMTMVGMRVCLRSRWLFRHWCAGPAPRGRAKARHRSVTAAAVMRRRRCLLSVSSAPLWGGSIGQRVQVVGASVSVQQLLPAPAQAEEWIRPTRGRMTVVGLELAVRGDGRRAPHDSGDQAQR